MKKMKVFCFGVLMSLGLAFVPTISTYANEAETEVISLEQALEMAKADMLALQDLDNIIRNMQMNQRDLRHNLDRIERGYARNDAMDMILNTMFELDMALLGANAAQNMISGQLDQSTQLLLAGAGNSDILQATLSGVAETQSLNAQIIAIEAQREALSGQMWALWTDEAFRDIIKEIERGLDEIDRQTRNIQLNQEIIEISLENGIRNMIIALEGINAGIEMLEASVAFADDSLRRANISYSLGMLSSYDLRSVEHGISQSHNQLRDLRRSRETIIQTMNNMLGLPITNPTIIGFQRDMPELPEDMDAHITSLVENAPTIQQLQLTVDGAIAGRREYMDDLDTSSAHGSVRTDRYGNFIISEADRRRAVNSPIGDEDIEMLRNRIALQDAVNRAETELARAKRTLEFEIRQAYRELEALQVQMDAQNRSLAQAQTSLTTAIANYNVGRGTQFEIEQARLGVTSAEQALESTYNQKWLLAFTLENPVLLVLSNQ
ncbi:MAG: TolC family protein [Defluviitaleaceae bacterium]|nr:TolC family protein [Defluviitaleaceae bacterium]